MAQMPIRVLFSRETDEPPSKRPSLALSAWRDSDLALNEGLVPALGVAGYALWRWQR
jgi:hypothetical protein